MSEDIRELNINQEDAMDRLAWKAKARKADPRHKKRQMEKKIGFFFRLNFFFREFIFNMIYVFKNKIFTSVFPGNLQFSNLQ